MDTGFVVLDRKTKSRFGILDPEAKRRRGGAVAAGKSLGRYEPLPPPPTERVQDPDGDGWWDSDLTPDQVQVRLAGLERTIRYVADNRDTPADWVAEERAILASLKRRARYEAEERPVTRDDVIHSLWASGMSQSEVAKAVGCAQSTVSITLKRIGATR